MIYRETRADGTTLEVEYDPEDVVLTLPDGEGHTCAFLYMPGMESVVMIGIDAGMRPCWGWDGNRRSPTFTPSIRTEYRRQGDGEPQRNHVFVTGGRVTFLSDCTHELAGQTVALSPIKDWPDWPN